MKSIMHQKTSTSREIHQHFQNYRKLLCFHKLPFFKLELLQIYPNQYKWPHSLHSPSIYPSPVILVLTSQHTFCNIFSFAFILFPYLTSFLCLHILYTAEPQANLHTTSFKLFPCHSYTFPSNILPISRYTCLNALLHYCPPYPSTKTTTK